MVPLEESWAGEAGRKKEEEQHLLQFCMLSNDLQTAALCQASKQKEWCVLKQIDPIWKGSENFSPDQSSC